MEKKKLFDNPTIKEDIPNNFLGIVNVLQENVDMIAKYKYKNDKCPPSFTVSILYGEEKADDRIILTVTHGDSFSKQIFPKKSIYDYEPLEKEIEYLYNATV